MIINEKIQLIQKSKIAISLTTTSGNIHNGYVQSIHDDYISLQTIGEIKKFILLKLTSIESLQIIIDENGKSNR